MEVKQTQLQLESELTNDREVVFLGLSYDTADMDFLLKELHQKLVGIAHKLYGSRVDLGDNEEPRECISNTLAGELDYLRRAVKRSIEVADRIMDKL